jgi:dipeptidyl aminopeptidase/acylaminoacyl peptidase
MHLRLFFILFCFSQFTHCQTPNTELFLVDIKNNKTQVSLLSNDNPEGYNNQPFKITDSVYYFVQKRPNETDTEIYSLDFRTQQKTRITNSLEDEYSPKIHPDGQSFTCVRVEQDSVSQHLWKFPLDRSNRGERLLTQYDNIGYYHWLDRNHIAFFLVDDPNELVICELPTGSSTKVSTNIGRTLTSGSENTLYFIDIFSDEFRYIKSYNIEENSSDIIVRIPNECQDFGYGNNGIFYIGNGSKIESYRPGRDVSWVEIADLEDFGIEKISRILPISKTKWMIVNVKEIK